MSISGNVPNFRTSDTGSISSPGLSQTSQTGGISTTTKLPANGTSGAVRTIGRLNIAAIENRLAGRVIADAGKPLSGIKEPGIATTNTSKQALAQPLTAPSTTHTPASKPLAQTSESKSKETISLEEPPEEDLGGDDYAYVVVHDEQEEPAPQPKQTTKPGEAIAAQTGLKEKEEVEKPAAPAPPQVAKSPERTKLENKIETLKAEKEAIGKELRAFANAPSTNFVTSQQQYTELMGRYTAKGNEIRHAEEKLQSGENTTPKRPDTPKQASGTQPKAQESLMEEVPVAKTIVTPEKKSSRLSGIMKSFAHNIHDKLTAAGHSARNSIIAFGHKQASAASRSSASDPIDTRSSTAANRSSSAHPDPQVALSKIVDTLHTVVDYQQKLAKGDVPKLKGTMLSPGVDLVSLQKEIKATLTNPNLKMTPKYDEFRTLFEQTLGSTMQAKNGKGGVQDEKNRASIKEFCNDILPAVTLKLNNEVALDAFSGFVDKFSSVSASWENVLSNLLEDSNLSEADRGKMPSLADIKLDFQNRQAETRELNTSRQGLIDQRSLLLDRATERIDKNTGKPLPVAEQDPDLVKNKDQLNKLDEQIAEVDTKISKLSKMKPEFTEYKNKLGFGSLRDEDFASAVKFLGFEGKEQKEVLVEQKARFKADFDNNTFDQKPVNQSLDKRGERASGDAVEFARLLSTTGTATIQALKSSTKLASPDAERLINEAQTSIERLNTALAEVKADKSQKMLDKFSAQEWETFAQTFIALNNLKRET